MHKYVVTGKELQGTSTLLLTLAPRRHKDQLQFFPGQYAAIGFTSNGRPSPVRCFSITSSPNKPDNLQFAMRVQGKFTRAVSSLKLGSPVFVYGPFGEFTINEQFDRDLVLLAGGIGITPFMSMIRNATEAKLPIRIRLLYSCHSQDDIPFYAELQELQRINPYLKVFYSITQGPIDHLTGSLVAQGRIDGSLLARVTGDMYNRFTFFICGPKSFTTSLRQTLLKRGTRGDRIVTEEFTPSAKPQQDEQMVQRGLPWWTYMLTGTSLVMATGFFMSLDLVHYVPKALASSSSAVPSGSSSAPALNTNPATNTDATNNEAQSTPDTSQSQATSQPQNTTTVPTPVPTSSYMPPVSSVS